MDMTRDVDFTDFVIASRPRLEGAARLLCPTDHSLAEDLVQQTLTKMYVRWPKLKSRSEGLLSYGYRTLTTTFIDETRRGFRRRESSMDQLPETPNDGPDLEVAALVRSALSQLPPRQRAVVVLRHWLDLPVEQTAAILGCRPGTVKSQSSKALESLRITLDDLYVDDTERN